VFLDEFREAHGGFYTRFVRMMQAQLHKTLLYRFHGLLESFCMDIKHEIGRRLSTSRDAAGLTLQEVCDAVPGLSTSRLSNYEQGTRTLPVQFAKLIAPILGVTADWLLTLTNDTPDPQEQCLLDHWRHTDDRGRRAILRVAEAESSYSVKEDDPAAEAA
jgi:transcriptional regulator with XRE-family HTH domain